MTFTFAHAVVLVMAVGLVVLCLWGAAVVWRGLVRSVLAVWRWVSVAVARGSAKR